MDSAATVAWPLLTLGVGMAIVLGMILAFRANAFLALITSALVISLMTPITKPFGESAPAAVEKSDGSLEFNWIAGEQITRVIEAFGKAAGNVGIVIALAAIIGLCLMESGAADRIVQKFMQVLGEKRSSAALMGSGFVLSIPVFFDTVFFLLVPLARTITRKRGGKDFLMYILAIAAGGAVTHALVPPTPGPLIMANELKIDLGVMILAGIAVGILPAIVGGLVFAPLANKLMPLPFRPIGDADEIEPLEESQLPSLFFSLAPIVLPVLLIATYTITKTIVDQSLNAGLMVSPGLENFFYFVSIIGNPGMAMMIATFVAMGLLKTKRNLNFSELAKRSEVALMSAGVIILITAAGGAFGAMLKEAKVGYAIQVMMAPDSGKKEEAKEAAKTAADDTKADETSKSEKPAKADDTKSEEPAMSADNEPPATPKKSPLSAVMILTLGFGVASLLKIAQGSSTVAMITTVGIISGLIGDNPSFHPVYCATAIGCGSLVGSWMNDSGFWIVSKMSGMTEAETLKTLTVCWAIIGVTGFLVTLVLASVFPLTSLM